ncbi:methyl-accepting chemotaxis protein McpS [mine drainage metagenome]|uniref:Methyl-accepting chemotaxis protein McpS n=1 Tax=mine drainage metagenome TaxID=410659 RepID=A0A1J5S389_9ZZZZ
MSFTTDRLRRLESMKIDERMREVLRSISPIIRSNIDKTIENAYRHFLGYPEVAAAYQGTGLTEAVAAQRSHWLDEIFPADFSDSQILKGVELFRRRQLAGLELRWYFVFYADLLRGFQATLAPHFRKKPDALVEAMNAISTVLLLDLEIAAAAFMQGSEEDAAAFIKNSAEDMQARVGQLGQKVEDAASGLRGAAQTMAQAAGSTLEQAAQADGASQESEAGIQAAASATEELASSIHEIGRQASDSSQMVAEAVNEAERANARVGELAEAAGKIGEVVKLIADIASQTNLLALNATIEAARAGEAGKGFAVVAGEVKNLANQTGKATSDISAQVAAVQDGTREAVTAIHSIGATIGRISEISSAIAAAVEEQGAATQEISRSVQQAASGGAMVHRSISGVRDSAQGSQQTAAGLLSGADTLVAGVQDLQRELGGLSGEVARFLEQTRKK